MNQYVTMMSQVIEYIDNNIANPLSAEELSNRFNLSAFHFNRLFTAITGRTLKKYVLGRKLAHAWDRLRRSESSVIETALECGFESPEVFSRAFKRQYGVSPSASRREGVLLDTAGFAKATIVERDIVNIKGQLAVKGSIVHRAPLILRGRAMVVDTNSPSYAQEMVRMSEVVLQETADSQILNNQTFYNVVKCQGDDSGIYDAFLGKSVSDTTAHDNLIDGMQSLKVDGGWYASFVYVGDMADIRETFEDDLYRWIAVKELSPNPESIGMLAIYEEDYYLTKQVRIFIPILRPTGQV